MKINNIMVTGAGGASGLYTIEILKRTTSYKIIAADSNPNAIGLYRADKGVRVPEANSPEFIKEINKIIEKEQIDLLIPNVSDELPILSENLNLIRCKTVISPKKTIQICNDKHKTYQFFSKDIFVPHEYQLSDINDNLYPIFIKPKISRGSSNAYKIQDYLQLKSTLEFLSCRHTPSKEIIIMEYLPGTEYTVDVLCDFQGKILSSLSRERITVDSGVSVMGKIVNLPTITNLINLIVSKLRFNGPINIQFKEDKNNICKLLEINPRFSGGISMTCLAGLNLPKILLQSLTGEKNTEVVNIPDGVKIGRIYQDLFLP